MEYVLGALVVVAVLAFVVLPLFRRSPAEAASPALSDTAQERAAIYRELLELELDQKVGKIAESDYQEQSAVLLARAASLISQEDAESVAVDAAIEREIAEARAALHRANSPLSSPEPADSAPAQETPA